MRTNIIPMPSTLAALSALTALGTTMAVADPIFSSGFASLEFNPGAGTPTSVTLSPIPVLLSNQLDASYSSGGLSASGTGGINHSESASHFGLGLTGGSGVSQTDNSGLLNGSAVVTISFNGVWEMGSQFGPTAIGYARFPSITGVVGEGSGSFVGFEVEANFTGGATRTPVNFSFTRSTPGAFSTSLIDEEIMTPDFIAAGRSETISGFIRFTARGIESTSSIGLGGVNGGTVPPVPEPEEYASAAVLALAGFAGLSRWRQSRRG